MAFEQAKQNFETKTKETPKKVEGNWKNFTNNAKSYLTRKQNEVSSFINKLNYPGKEQDKNNYLASMNKAIDDVIDGNEATKKEMTHYNRLLYKKSNELKYKLLREKRAMEIKEVKDGLSNVVSAFQNNGIPLDIKDNVTTYLSLSKEKRIPLKTISTSMTKLINDASSLLSRQEMIKNKNVLYTIFNHYCWGNADAAKQETVKLNEHLDFFKKCNNVRQKTGLKLNNVELNGMMSALIKVGTPKKTVDQFIIKNYKKLKKIGGANFDKLLTTLSKASLSRFLLTALIAVNEGKSLRALDGIKMTMQVESTLTQRQLEAGKKLKNMYGYLKTEIKQLKEYRKKHPREVMNKEIARLQKEIAISLYSIAGHKKTLLLIAAQRSLANSFMSMKKMNPSSRNSKKIMDSILNAKSSEQLERLAIDKCNFAKIPQIPLLQAAELKFSMSENELEVKKWYERNPMIDNPLNLHDVLNQYYKTGKLSFGARRAFNEQFNFQASHLREQINDNEMNVQDLSDYFKDIQTKYGSLTKVPKDKIKEVSLKLSGYMNLLRNMYTASVKLQGNLESLLIMSPGDEKLKKEIQEVKKKAKYYAKQLNTISKFMGLKTNPDISDVDSLVESPLFGPLIQKEINPYIQSMNSYMEKVGDAARPIPFIGKKIQRRAKQNPRMVNYEFDQGIKQIVNLTQSMKAARTNALGVKSKIEQSLKDTSKIKGLPRSIVLQREKYLKNVLAKLDIALKDPKSPLSLNAIKKVNEQADKIKSAQDKYNREGFWKGVASAVILAGAVAFAVAGGWAAGALGTQLFGTATTGTFVAGLIPVSAGVSNFAIGSMSMMGVAAGGVLGSRAVMSGFDALGLVDFGGMGKIWKPEDLMDDYSTAFVTSLLVVGAAKGIVGALKNIATAEYFAFRFPGLVRFSRTALSKMEIISKFSSPSNWFQAGNGIDKNSILRRFGIKVVEESSEETEENTAGKIHPVLEFLVSVANSADGMNIKLSTHGLKTNHVGIVTEGSRMAYTTATPQEFVANLKEKFGIQKGTGYDTTINTDGSVTVDLFSYDINPKSGERVYRKFSTLKVHPAQLSTNLTPDVEMARVPGLKSTTEGNTFNIQNAEESINIFSNLRKRGFLIVKTTDNTFKVSKGDKSFTINVPTKVIAHNRAKVSSWVDTPLKKRAFQKFVELNENYKRLLAKYPKLAKVLPADLVKAKLILVPVLGLACGMPLELRSIEQVTNYVPVPTQNLNKLTYESNIVNADTREHTLDSMGITKDRDLIRETYFDKATGLLNRNGLALGENILRQGKKLSVANFDADHFRASNELKGHSYGDAQIQIIARNINQTVMDLRKAGYKAYAVRMGGEEFTLMTTAPQEVLHKKMLDMSARTKQEMLSTLSANEKFEMAEHIARTKYAKDPNGITKAYSELGGISGSIIGIDGKALDWSRKGNMQKALMYADASMEDLKKMHGRGNFELDKRTPTSTSKRINRFQIHNVLDTTQKGNLGKETKRLFGSAEKQFEGRLKTLRSVTAKLPAGKQKSFFSEITKVLSSPDSTNSDISKVLQKFGVDTSISQKLRKEYVTTLRNYGNYTGARTMNSYQKEMTQKGTRFESRHSWKIEIGKFKSINETLGHVGGDTYLTFVYQDVIISTIKDMGIPFGTKKSALIVSQKGADFHFCFSSEYLVKHPGIEQQFQSSLNAKYKQKYDGFVDRLNQGSNNNYQAERNKWLKENEQSNPDATNQQYNLFFHQ